jgi:hypothetical protein
MGSGRKAMRARFGAIVVGAWLVGAAAASAHHAFSAEFDAQKPVNLKGTVTKMDWINPHAWVHIDVKHADGSVDKWMIEGGAPNALLRRGFSRTSLMPGTEIVVSGFQAKNGLKRANGHNITFTDGRVLFVGSSGIGAPYEGSTPPDKK